MASLARKGRRVILADATRGEMGTRGTPEIRAEEAAEAARILGVERINLGLPDGGIGRDMEASVHAVVKAIRAHRPRLVFTHTGSDHHPDHNALHSAVRQAFFNSNVLKYETGQERFKAARLYFFWSHREMLPARIDFIADVSETYEVKVEALKAHRSQVAGSGFVGPETFLTGDLFWHRFHARFGYFGSLIGVRFGEPYVADGTLRIDDPTELPDAGGG
jgi:bacillithiol biosynthesis deacetylase BshB1